MTTDNILARVHKLLRLSQNNNSAEEAAAAGAAAQRLIDEHNLSEAMLSLDASQPQTPDEPIVDFRDDGMALEGSGRWAQFLAVAVAKANGAKLYLRGGKGMHLIGRPSDVETTRYLYSYLHREVERLANQRRGSGTTWLNNFRLGCVEAISASLKAQRAAFEREALAKAAPGALVLVQAGLAKVEQRLATVDAWTKENLKLRAGRSSQRVTYDSGARAAGRQAGATISIHGQRGSLVSGAKALRA